MNMADEHVEFNFNADISAQEIDEVVSQFRLFNRRLSPQSVTSPRFLWTALTSPRQRQKLFGELPKMTETDLVTSGRQGELLPALTLHDSRARRSQMTYAPYVSIHFLLR